MSARAATLLAWSLAGLSVVMFVATVALTISSLYVAPATQPSSTGGTLGDLLLWIPFLAFPLVGALIASKRPTNPIGWICLVAGLFWMLIFLWGLHPQLGIRSGDDRRANPVDLGTPRGAARDLPDPAVPRREAPLQEVASSGLVLWSGDGLGQCGPHPQPRAIA
jgi:hypothetical protein